MIGNRIEMPAGTRQPLMSAIRIATAFWRMPRNDSGELYGDKGMRKCVEILALKIKIIRIHFSPIY